MGVFINAKKFRDSELVTFAGRDLAEEFHVRLVGLVAHATKVDECHMLCFLAVLRVGPAR